MTWTLLLTLEQFAELNNLTMNDIVERHQSVQFDEFMNKKNHNHLFQETHFL